jgi:hypothetical protein
VILREDVVNFLNTGLRASATFRTYQPISSTRSDYASILFRLDGSESLSTDNKVYLLGDFNQWTVSPESEMVLDSLSGLWQNRQILKEGTYSYQYIKLDETNQIDLSSLSDNSSANVQEYMSFVYYNDPERKFDRLLAIETFYAR